MGIPDHLTCFLRNLYATQEATVRTGYGKMDWFQIWKGVGQGCVSSICLFNLYAKYNIRNAKLDEAQAGIKIAGRNINILTYADGTTLMAESKEELKTLLMEVNEKSEKAGLKQHSKHKSHGIWSHQFSLVQSLSCVQLFVTPWTAACWSHHFMANKWGNNGNSDRLYFLGLQNHCLW